MKRSTWLWIGGVALLLGAGAGAYLLLSDAPTDEIAELLQEGGEKLLHQPLREARADGPRVLVFALDGVGEGELADAIASGEAPRLAALIGAPIDSAGTYANAYTVPGVLSVLPSTTLAAWASLFTGQPPARTGVPGNEWFVREEARFYAPGPVTVSGIGDAVRVYSDGLLGSLLHAPTLYELAQVRSYVTLSQFHRGADVLTIPKPGALGNVLAAAVEGITGEGEVNQEIYAELDETAVESLLETFEERGLPDLQVVYLPGVDLYTHVAEAPTTNQESYVTAVIDVAVGAVLDAYRSHGALDETYVLVVADHGHTPVLGDDRHSLGVGGDDEPTAILEGAGFRVREAELELDDDERDFQAVVAYQGAIAYVYLADRSTCVETGDACDWPSPPRFDLDVLPVVRAFDAANRTGAGVPEMQGTLDLIFARQPGLMGVDATPFEIWDGSRLVPIAEYLALNPRPDLLELESRMNDLAAGPFGNRAGDILLLTRSGLERPIEERFYFSSVYRSWHGSPTEQDSRIPLVVAHPGKDGAALREEVRAAVGDNPSQLDITGLILSLLGRPAAPGAFAADSASAEAVSPESP